MDSVNAGAVVVLKGAVAPYLTVTRVIDGQQRDTVEVAWFKDGELKTAIIASAALKLVKE